MARIERQFFQSGLASDHTATIHFRSCSRKGQYSSQRQCRIHPCAFCHDVPRFIPLETSCSCNKFRPVNHGTSSYSQKKSHVFLFCQFHGPHQSLVFRVRFDTPELYNIKPLQRIHHLFVDTVFLDASTTVGHHNFHPFRNPFCDLGNFSFPEKNFHGIVIIEISHALKSFITVP